MKAFENLPLQTHRLTLRPLRESDEHALFEIFSDSSVMRYWSTPPWTSPEPGRRMIASDMAQTTKDHLRLGVEHNADASLIGTCTLFSINHTSRRAEIGYALRSVAWGHGYMLEALQRLLDYGFRELNLNRIEADIDPRNAASAKSLERIGFVKEGRLRERWIVGEEICDTAMYGLLQRDWTHPNGQR
jgi:[ribosomal protein S5]-alanine N-acetyltransferase